MHGLPPTLSVEEVANRDGVTVLSLDVGVEDGIKVVSDLSTSAAHVLLAKVMDLGLDGGGGLESKNVGS